jgi:hypothetical protein
MLVACLSLLVVVCNQLKEAAKEKGGMPTPINEPRSVERGREAITNFM